MQTSTLILGVIMMMMITFGQKLLPFMALSTFRNSQAIAFLGRELPAGVMLVLALFTIKSGWQGFSMPSLVMIVPAAMTAVVHVMFRQPILSIGVGVVSYGLMKSVIF